MKILVVSHSYLEPENRKNIIALSKSATVKAVVPSKGPVLVFLENSFQHDDHSRDLVEPIRSVWFSYSTYILASLDLGFRKFKPDIINVEYNPWSIMFLQSLICRSIFCPQAKIVCTIKKNTFVTPKSFKGWLKGKLARWTLAKTDHVIAASEMVRQMLVDNFNYPIGKIDVCHHLAVDTNLFSPVEEPVEENVSQNDDEIVIGFSGWFTEEKGLLDLIDAVAVCRRDDHLPVSLNLIGQGKLGPRLNDLAETREWFNILDAVPNAEVADFLRELDIFVMPSHIVCDHQEHDAHALMEALSCGVVSIASHSGIIPELLDDGTGLLVEPKDIDSLAEAIGGLSRDATKRKTLGALSREKAMKEFSLKAVAERRLEIFRKIIDG